ncbi:MAG: hypothetical protein HY020_07155 [Burkholderiales bacterium]|nr:hypothetical protein [Burkholderiales bacterium]
MRSDQRSVHEALFETYFVESRDANRRSVNLTKRPDGSYVDDHTQRHWWTWQCAVAAAAQLSAKSEEQGPQQSP